MKALHFRHSWALRAALIFLWSIIASAASAHEVRPAFLQITERPNGHYDVLWKQPTMGSMAVHLVPRISGGLLDAPPTTTETAANFQVRLWRNLDSGAQGLEGRPLQIVAL